MMVPLVQLEDAVGGHLLGVMDVGVMMMVVMVDVGDIPMVMDAVDPLRIDAVMMVMLDDDD